MDNAYTMVPPATRTAPVPEKKFLLTKTAYNKVGLAALFVYLTSQLIATVLLIVLASGYIVSGLSELVENRYFEQGSAFFDYITNTVSELINPNGLIYGIYTIGSYVLGFGIALLIEKRAVRSIPSSPIPKRKLTGAEFGFYIFIALGLWAIGIYMGNIPSLFGVPSIMDFAFGTSGPGILLMSANAIICAPILEELLFRKVLLDKLHGYGQVPAAFVTALLFGLMHGNSGQFFLAFNVGLLFAVVYMKTGNVLYTMTLHFIINFTASLPDILGYFGITEIGAISFETLMYILLAVLAVIVTVVMIRTRRSELFAITKSECPNLRKAILSNPGMWIFPIYACLTVGMVDLLSFFYGIFLFRVGPIAFLTFIPLGLFIAAIIVFYKNIGTRSGAEIVPMDYTASDGAAADVSAADVSAADVSAADVSAADTTTAAVDTAETAVESTVPADTEIHHPV